MTAYHYAMTVTGKNKMIDPKKIKLSPQETKEAEKWRLKKCGKKDFGSLKKGFHQQLSGKKSSTGNEGISVPK